MPRKLGAGFRRGAGLRLVGLQPWPLESSRSSRSQASIPSSQVYRCTLGPSTGSGFGGRFKGNKPNLLNLRTHLKMTPSKWVSHFLVTVPCLGDSPATYPKPTKPRPSSHPTPHPFQSSGTRLVQSPAFEEKPTSTTHTHTHNRLFSKTRDNLCSEEDAVGTYLQLPCSIKNLLATARKPADLQDINHAMVDSMVLLIREPSSKTTSVFARRQESGMCCGPETVLRNNGHMKTEGVSVCVCP